MKKMRDDQDFNINFVQIVKREPSLYDKSLPEYRNKEEHERIWKKISSQVKESVPHCKERWRNLRACLTRHIKNTQTGQIDSAPHKPYYLADHMTFLLPFTKSRSIKDSSRSSFSIELDDFVDLKRELIIKNDDHRNVNSKSIKIDTDDVDDDDDNDYNENDDQQTNNSESDEYDEQHESPHQQQQQQQQQQQPEIDSNSSIDNCLTISTVENVKYLNNIGKSIRKTPTIESTSQIQQQQQTSNKRTCSIDKGSVISIGETKRIRLSTAATADTKEIDEADITFFRSLLPDIRQMDSSQKRKFKIGIFQLISNILEPKSE